MTNDDAFRTTAKGRAEIAAKPGELKPGIRGLLAAIGEKATAENLRNLFPRAGNIAAALDMLLQEGYIESLSSPAPAPDPNKVDKLKNFLSQRPKEPTLQQRKQAEGTLSGARRLKAGYQISILNRPGKPVAPRGGGKHVILIIDSHEAEALAAARAMMQGGFDIRGAANRTEIAAALAKTPLPDLIFIDVEMHDAVGLDVLGKLHEHPQFKSTPIIVVTARAERDDIVAALAYGASGYLNKPVKPDTLLRHAKDALGLA